MSERVTLIPSSKKMGIYEKELLSALKLYFEHRGFKVHSHVQLNISWGNIISDVDLVLESEGQLFGIEVKSKRDNLKNLVTQIDRMFDFFDGVYVATDNPKWMSRKELADERIGILIVNGLQIAEKTCQFSVSKPRPSTMIQLRKICLSRLSGMVNGKTNGDKNALVSFILNGTNAEHLRLILKSIVMCERECKENCPLWIVEKQWMTPLKNVRTIVEKYSTDLKTLPLLPADFKEKLAKTKTDEKGQEFNEKTP